MQLPGVVLGLHIAAGSAGLIVGPLAMVARKHRGAHTRLGMTYHALVAVLTCSAIGLVLFAPGRLWPLGLIAIATEAAALAGWLARRRARPGWLPVHISLMCGSYVSFLTAFLVVNWSSPLAWALPTLLGSPLIALTAARAGRAVRRPAPAGRPG